MRQAIRKNLHRLLIRSLAASILALTLAATPSFADGEYSKQGADTCIRCHKTRGPVSMTDFFQTAHGSRADPGSPFANTQCEACHGGGGTHQKGPKKEGAEYRMRTFGSGAATPVDEQNAVCLGCHKDRGRLGWFGSIHEEEDVSCANCHSIHAGRDHVFDPFAQQEACFGCHPRKRAESLRPSTHPLRFGEMSCSGCHDPHDGNNDMLLLQATVNDTCYTCHAEKRGPFLFEHAPATEDCTLCHNAHGSIHRDMLTLRPPLLCQQCHSARGHPSVAYTPDTADAPLTEGFLLGNSCTNCHSQIHGSNHPSGVTLLR